MRARKVPKKRWLPLARRRALWPLTAAVAIAGAAGTAVMRRRRGGKGGHAELTPIGPDPRKADASPPDRIPIHDEFSAARDTTR